MRIFDKFKNMDNIYTTLVNKQNKISEDFINSIKLINTKDVNDNDILIEEETYNAFIALKDYLCKVENILIGIDDAYRSEEEQIRIYKEFVSLYGKEYANSFVAPIGCSEHQTGLAIDLIIYFDKEGFISCNDNYDRTTAVFESKVHKHLSDFGFILRYPKGKEDITLYPYEPWHIRYVGIEQAKEIYSENVTLEEYKEKKKVI